MTHLHAPGQDSREIGERILFARGVLEILKNTGLFNFLIERAIEDLDAVSRELPAILADSGEPSV